MLFFLLFATIAAVLAFVVSLGLVMAGSYRLAIKVVGIAAIAWIMVLFSVGVGNAHINYLISKLYSDSRPITDRSQGSPAL